MQQRCALPRSAITNNFLALLRRLQKEVQECELRRFDLPGKTLVALHFVESCARLIGQNFGNVGVKRMTLALDAAGIYAERPAVRFQFFDVKHSQAVGLYDPDGAQQREV